MYLTQAAETGAFDDKFLRFSVKKAVDQRLSPLGQFLIKVSRFASAPNVQSEVDFPSPCAPKRCCGRSFLRSSHRRQIKRVPLNIGNDKGKVRPLPPYTPAPSAPPAPRLAAAAPPPPPPARPHIPSQSTVSYTVTCFPAADAAATLPPMSAVANAASLPPDVIPPAPKPSAAPPAPPIPREQFIASATHTKSDHNAADAEAVAPTASTPASANPVAAASANPVAASDSAAPRPAAPISKPTAPKSAVKLNDPQDRLDTSQHQLRQVDVSAHQLPNLQLDDIRNFDRDSLLRLSVMLLSRQHASGSNVSHSASATELSSATSSHASTDVARLQATVEILKVRPAA